MSHTQLALDWTTQFQMAVRQMSALLRLRATLQDDMSDYEADIRSAKAWQEQDNAIAAKERETNPPRGVAAIDGLPSAAPPPPPPPAPH